MAEVPLIWTSKGNLPVSSLQYETRWENTPEYVKFIEIYMLNGEIVKESAHILSKRGLSTDAIQQVF